MTKVAVLSGFIRYLFCMRLLIIISIDDKSMLMSGCNGESHRNAKSKRWHLFILTFHVCRRELIKSFKILKVCAKCSLAACRPPLVVNMPIGEESSVIGWLLYAGEFARPWLAMYNGNYSYWSIKFRFAWLLNGISYFTYRISTMTQKFQEFSSIAARVPRFAYFILEGPCTK